MTNAEAGSERRWHPGIFAPADSLPAMTMRRGILWGVALLLLLSAGCSKPAELIGEAGSESEVDRVIEITASDELRFDPSEIDVSTGETIEFQITNGGKTQHEFVLGTAAHEHEHGMSSHPNATDPIDPGATESVIWHFTDAGEVVFACHIAGHDKQGMTGTITISG
ncbi:MAG: hypothetical protein QOG16_337 [Actinomycetota bacterium]|nr:hypothetical protein [Actinomycetota bacterium]